MDQTARIAVHGRVQGVWFRASAREEAVRLGLTGFVQNENDGSVCIEATGSPEQIKALIKWCRNGPRLAQVTSVSVLELSITPFDGFEIRR